MYFEWDPWQLFTPPPADIQNDDDVSIDDIDGQDNITDSDGLNDDIVDQHFEGDAYDGESLYHSINVTVIQDDADVDDTNN